MVVNTGDQVGRIVIGVLGLIALETTLENRQLIVIISDNATAWGSINGIGMLIVEKDLENFEKDPKESEEDYEEVSMIDKIENLEVGLFEIASNESRLKDINCAIEGYFSNITLTSDEDITNEIATACALTAFKLRHPIKMYLDRSTDMVMVGGRHPMKITYSVGFKSDGKITALYLNLLVNAGISEDYSPLIPHAIISCLKKYNWGALAFDIKLCKTNLTSKSSMRAPGQAQGSYIAEAIIERVASFLSLDVDVVRKRNLHTYESLKFFYGSSSGEAPEYTLPAIVDELFASASYFNRLEMVLHFNSCNKWKKRGISWVPIVYEVEPKPTPGKVSILNDGSIVVEVGGIEIGQGLWTKVKQMAAFGLEQLWDEEKKYLLDRVRIIQADTLSLVQGGLTAGSTKSEASCEAVRLACSILVSRLKPLKQSLEEQMGSISWDTLITQANLQYVNLSASTFWVADDTSSYLNYGAAISEVEIDVLTGATTILRADLTYDCGQSLSPAVDLGQVEGSFVQGIGFFVLLILFNI
ncbi:putative aldehyde oxidase-like protein [Zingiber officinale]|uniref:putative aldehyde oxidase-like protein n=1 Tax=Zingiber officinale TaxID=94328 RepID=UPI001C4D8A0F|nr:putative aldehyde oxidase-like protein [Zingiber officinale]